MAIPGWATLSQAARDAAYNNNLAVANSAELIERRNAASAAFRNAHPAGLDVPYGPAPRQRFDLFAAAEPRRRASCSSTAATGSATRARISPPSPRAIMAHGWSVAMVGYTLAPDVVARRRSSARSARRSTGSAQNGAKHGLARRPIVVSGWSAGGHLTAMALAHPRVTAGLAISGVLRARADQRDLSRREAAADRRGGRDAVAAAAAGGAETAGDRLRHRELPALVADSRDLHARRSAAGAPGPLLPIAGADHFTILEELRRPDGKLVRAALDLVGKT